MNVAQAKHENYVAAARVQNATKLENVDLYLTKLSEAFLAIPSPEQKTLFNCYLQERGDEFLTAKSNVIKPRVTPSAQVNKP